MRLVLILLTVLLLHVADSGAAWTASPSQPQDLMSQQQKAGKSLYWWADGPISAEPTSRPGKYDFWAPNGPNVAQTSGSLANPANVVSNPARVIPHPDQPDVGYLSGGPVHDLGGSKRLMFVHLERYPTGSIRVFYGSIGLAFSGDRGKHWKFLGEIFQPNVPYAEFQRCGDVVNASFGQSVIRRVDGRRYFYAYSYDHHTGSCVLDYAVFRAPVKQVRHAAAQGTVSSWTKYHKGAFTEPALGGSFSDILPGAQTADFAVGYNAYVDRLLFVYPHRDGRQNYYEWRIAASQDGINWSPLQPLGDVTYGERYAPSLIGTGDEPQITGRKFWIYYTASQGSEWDRWPASTLTRQKVTLRRRSR
jgi:hypothetical protein